MEPALTRAEISSAVSAAGWRYVLGTLRTTVDVGSLDEALDVAGAAVVAAGAGADDRLTVDVRGDRVGLVLQTSAVAAVTPADIDAAVRISTRLGELGRAGEPRSSQLIEIAIDAIDIAAIRPFWKAVLAYVDEPGRTGPEDAIVDPAGRGPAVWFQQMDAPRPQRNRIHLDVSVPHDEAAARIEAALTAGARLVSNADAPAFWVLADREGNEACITTWQGRD